MILHHKLKFSHSSIEQLEEDIEQSAKAIGYIQMIRTSKGNPKLKSYAAHELLRLRKRLKQHSLENVKSIQAAHNQHYSFLSPSSDTEC